MNYICVHSQSMSLFFCISVEDFYVDRKFTLDEFKLMNVNTVDVPVTVNVIR